MADCINALKEWTGKANVTIVFDSTFDEFTDDGLFDKVKGKPNIALVGVTTEGDVFGMFYSRAVSEPDKEIFDPNIFIFSFESHGRCTTPQRFALKEKKKGLKEKAFVGFYKSDYGFVWFGVYGVGSFTLGNEKSESFCMDLSVVFEGLEDTTLTGQNNPGTGDNGQYHHCTRLVALQLA